MVIVEFELYVCVVWITECSLDILPAVLSGKNYKQHSATWIYYYLELKCAYLNQNLALKQ